MSRKPSAPFPFHARTHARTHSTSLRLRNLHTTLSCMLVYQQLTTQTLKGAGPCHKTWCIVHIAQFSVHGSTRGEHCSQSLPRRGAPEWPKLRALQARRRAESVQISEIRPLNRASLPAISRSCQILSNSPISEQVRKKGQSRTEKSGGPLFNFEQSLVNCMKFAWPKALTTLATERAPRNLKH